MDHQLNHENGDSLTASMRATRARFPDLLRRAEVSRATCCDVERIVNPLCKRRDIRIDTAFCVATVTFAIGDVTRGLPAKSIWLPQLGE